MEASKQGELTEGQKAGRVHGCAGQLAANGGGHPLMGVFLQHEVQFDTNRK